MANKKELTPTQRKRKYKAGSYGFMVGEILAFFAPFVTIAIANYDKYFVEYEGTKISVGFFVAMGVMGFTIWGVANDKFKNTFILLLIKYVLFAFCFTMLAELMSDIGMIMWFGLIGLLGSYGLDFGRQNLMKKAKLIDEATKIAEKETLVEEVKEEKKIKVRIKKD